MENRQANRVTMKIFFIVPPRRLLAKHVTPDQFGLFFLSLRRDFPTADCPDSISVGLRGHSALVGKREQRAFRLGARGSGVQGEARLQVGRQPGITSILNPTAFAVPCLVTMA
jgi:hypothetical protein